MRTPRFLHQLLLILEDESHSSIQWCQDGSAIKVAEPKAFATHVLPVAYKHNKFPSFLRQLNLYGFRKISRSEHVYENKLFVRGRADLLQQLCKQKKAAATAKTSTSVMPLQRRVNKLKQDLAWAVSELNKHNSRLSYDWRGLQFVTNPAPHQAAASPVDDSSASDSPTSSPGYEVPPFHEGFTRVPHAHAAVPHTTPFGAAPALNGPSSSVFHASPTHWQSPYSASSVQQSFESPPPSRAFGVGSCTLAPEDARTAPHRDGSCMLPRGASHEIAETAQFAPFEDRMPLQQQQQQQHEELWRQAASLLAAAPRGGAVKVASDSANSEHSDGTRLHAPAPAQGPQTLSLDIQSALALLALKLQTDRERRKTLSSVLAQLGVASPAPNDVLGGSPAASAASDVAPLPDRLSASRPQPVVLAAAAEWLQRQHVRQPQALQLPHSPIRQQPLLPMPAQLPQQQQQVCWNQSGLSQDALRAAVASLMHRV